MGEVQLTPPTKRACVRCGREDVWSTTAGEWTIRVVDGVKRSGERFCMHE